MQPKLFNSYEDAAAFLEITTIGSPDLSWIQPKDRKAIVAQVKLYVIHEAHNKANNFKADWTNDSQVKYTAWHWITADPSIPSGLGFSRSACAYWNAFTDVGARLSVGTADEAIHIADTFFELYQDWYFYDKLEEGEKSAEGGE